MIALAAIMVLRCPVAFADVDAIQIENSNTKPSIIVPAVHGPIFGIQAPSAAVFAGKTVLVSEGTADRNADTQPGGFEEPSGFGAAFVIPLLMY